MLVVGFYKDYKVLLMAVLGCDLVLFVDKEGVS